MTTTAIAALVLLSPSGLLVAAAAAAPLAALALAGRRVRLARSLLHLDPPPPARRGAAVVALAAVPLLLAVAAAQPAMRSLQARHVRSDAQVFVVFDISRSMQASAGLRAPSRLERARHVALRLRAALPDVPTGVATFTDRALPELFPSPDEAAFVRTVERAVSVESPPPRNAAVTATDFASLADFELGGFFPPRVRRRLLVVLTDGESRPFAPSAIARGLASGVGASALLIQFWARDERIYGPRGSIDPRYRPDPSARRQLESLAAATGGRLLAENDVGAAAAAARAALGRGPTAALGLRTSTTPLAPYIALASLIPLAVVLRRLKLPGGLRWPRRRDRRTARIMKSVLGPAPGDSR